MFDSVPLWCSSLSLKRRKGFKKKKNRCCVCIWCKQAFSRGTWPLVIAKIELDLHLACHKQLCSASTRVLLYSRFPSSLISLCSSLLLKPLRMTPKIIEKPAQSVTKILTCFSKKGMRKGKERDRGEAGKESEEEREDFFFWWAAHWYDSLIFWAMVWSSLRGHPSIIRPVTSSLFSSSAPTLIYVCVWL